MRLLGNGPRLESELREGLKRHKPEIILLLQDRTRKGPGRYRCAFCWAWFPRDDLTSVKEQVGRGLRCVDCLEG